MREVRIRPLARADLEEIWFYTLETWGANQADRYLRESNAAVQKLSTDADDGRSEEDLREGYRSIDVGRHLVFYVFTDESVSVRRVLHDQMDIPRHL